MQKCTPSLEQKLRQLGFAEGAPPHIPPAIVAADIRIYRVLRCECGHRGHSVQPLHRDRAYRLVCSCRKCGHQVEG